MPEFKRIIVAAFAAFGTTEAAEAVVFTPTGQTPHYNDQTDYYADLEPQAWPGDVLASRTTPFDIRASDESSGREAFVTGTLTNEVVRESESGYLSFHYKVDITGGSGDIRDFEGINLRGFNTYFTDFRADVSGNETGALSRDEGGDSFYFRLGERSEHWLIVRTDAPAYAEGGEFIYQADWDGLGVDGSVHLATFKPVPEPCTVGTIGFIAAAALLRRRRCPSMFPPPAAGR